MNFLPLDQALKIAGQFAMFMDVVGIRVSVGDFNKNDKVDVSFELVLEDGDGFELGPIDVVDQVDDVVDAVSAAVGLGMRVVGADK